VTVTRITRLGQLVQVAVHGAVQQAPPQPARQRIARHAEHGVRAGVGDGGSEVGYADGEAVTARASVTHLIAEGREVQRDARAQLPPQLAAVDWKVKPVESAPYDYETQAAYGGCHELRTHAGCPGRAMREEQTEEAGDVAAPAAGEDGGGGAQGGGVKHVHFLAVVGGGHGGGFGP
jgi:hypothetical protein